MLTDPPIHPCLSDPWGPASCSSLLLHSAHTLTAQCLGSMSSQRDTRDGFTLQLSI